MKSFVELVNTLSQTGFTIMAIAAKQLQLNIAAVFYNFFVKFFADMFSISMLLAIIVHMINFKKTWFYFATTYTLIAKYFIRFSFKFGICTRFSDTYTFSIIYFILFNFFSASDTALLSILRVINVTLFYTLFTLVCVTSFVAFTTVEFVRGKILFAMRTAYKLFTHGSPLNLSLILKTASSEVSCLSLRRASRTNIIPQVQA